MKNRLYLNYLLLHAGLLFILIVLVGLINSVFELNSNYILIGFTTQFIVFGLSSLLFFRLSDIDYKSYLKFSSINFNDILKISGLIVLGLLIISFASTITIFIKDALESLYDIKIGQLVQEKQAMIIETTNGFNFIYLIVLMTITPAILEEIAFRGILLNNLLKWSGKKSIAVFFSAFVFAAFHFQVLGFLPILLVGLGLGYIYLKTNNILYPMLIHFGINLIQILVLKF